VCGIAGVVSADPAARSEQMVREMLATIAHRGPDDEGLHRAKGATLGARRLAVIDLQLGHQPMTNETGDVVAVQNGEIYNFEDLRAELKSKGHRFETRSDTEVIPHAYEEWGDDFVERLRGMFALALWDERRRRLVLARDRFGKKPLCYVHRSGVLLFASEIQALLVHPAVPSTVDDRAIADYLVFGYVPAPASAFAAIRKVPPGHTLVLEDDELETRRYWRLAFGPKLRISAAEAEEELRRKIDEAVRIRLVSDVPIGAFLSGGLDSSTVVAFMAAHLDMPVRTFSVGFRERAYDELRYARAAADAFGTEHHEFVVDHGETDVLPMLVRHLGEPFADSSIVPTYHVARMTRQHVTVALTGDGGDEIFGGYDRHRAAALAAATIDRMPTPLGRTIGRMATALPQSLPRALVRWRRFLVAAGESESSRYLWWTGLFTGPVRGLVRSDGGGDNSAQARVVEAMNATGATDPAERFMAADASLYLPEDLLVKMDIASMSCSLETRAPLLDHVLAEFVARLPVEYKLSPFSSKVLLRRAMRGVLPREILGRRKMGFAAPVASWLRGPLRNAFTDLVLAPGARALSYVDRAGVMRLFSAHDRSEADHSRALWSLLILELWFRECVAARPPIPIAVGERAS
jgi:asparagine synthase (glutamine-hydrolysing)